MFATEKHIDTLAQLIEALLKYFDTEKAYLRLSLSEKITRLITALMITTIILMLSFIMVLFLGTAFAFALASIVGAPWAFVLTAALTFVLILMVLAFKKSLIERPLIRIITEILGLNGDIAQVRTEAEDQKEAIGTMWHDLTKHEEKAPQTKTQKFLAFVDKSSVMIDGVLLGWKLYRKLKGSKKRR